tara:strand:- start:5130 stop:5330 length:201 start_codon:yes stop_codon:yes gene_type:complete
MWDHLINKQLHFFVAAFCIQWRAYGVLFSILLLSILLQITVCARKNIDALSVISKLMNTSIGQDLN